MQVYPKKGNSYNITTSLGNIIKDAVFIEDINFDTKTVKLFKQPNGHKVTVNPSYVVEVEEVQEKTSEKGILNV
jgi:hypothetical protein